MRQLPLLSSDSTPPPSAAGPAPAAPITADDLERDPLVIACGLGVDSVAMLVGLHARGIRPDLILFADTGNEWPDTYAYLPVLQAWLARVGFPPVVVVKKVVTRFKNSPYTTLEGNCISNRTLPSISFGLKACSQKWKRDPQDKYVNGWQPARDCWAAGRRVIKAIGYDAGPKDSKRSWSLTDDKKYRYWYPLREWGWAREECQRQIAAAGLPVPKKSACWFCLATQPEELDDLCRRYPELARRIVVMEANAAGRLTTTEGLWRTSTKKRPGRMTDWIAKNHPQVLDGLELPTATGEVVDVSVVRLPTKEQARFLAAIGHRGLERLEGKQAEGVHPWAVQAACERLGWATTRPGTVCPWERYWTPTPEGQRALEAYRHALTLTEPKVALG